MSLCIDGNAATPLRFSCHSIQQVLPPAAAPIPVKLSPSPHPPHASPDHELRSHCRAIAAAEADLGAASGGDGGEQEGGREERYEAREAHGGFSVRDPTYLSHTRPVSKLVILSTSSAALMAETPAGARSYRRWAGRRRRAMRIAISSACS